MKNTWQYNSRLTLKGAEQSNDFFQTQQFNDKNFPIKIPIEFANLINKNNPNDPLLQQVLPSNNPDIKTAGFSLEPLEDDKKSPVAGLIHKYPNRVLLIASSVCAIHCQYCFRQNFNYAAQDALHNWKAIEDYILSQTQINEVILSGGDPLSLNDEKLEDLIHKITQIPHIKTLRIHSRNAVVTPSRITDKLAHILNNSPLNVVLVLHCNHTAELSGEFVKLIKKLQKITLLNQSVLLKGVNDNLPVLTELSNSLFALGILPYYLHLLDKVSGAQKFWVDDKRAKQIHLQLQKNLSGYLVPKLVRDENLATKTWVG